MPLAHTNGTKIVIDSKHLHSKRRKINIKAKANNPEDKANKEAVVVTVVVVDTKTVADHSQDTDQTPDQIHTRDLTARTDKIRKLATDVEKLAMSPMTVGSRKRVA